MKLLVVLAVALACVVANPVTEEIPIIRFSSDISPEGSFQYVYETGNGIYAEANGEIKNQNSDNPALSIRGGYKYTAPDGTPVELVYTADEDGFKPESALLPTPHPTPEAIARSLAYIAANPPKSV